MLIKKSWNCYQSFFSFSIYLFSFTYLAALSLCCCTWDCQSSLRSAESLESCSMRTLSCSMWDLVPRPGIKVRPPALRVWSLSYWTIIEVPRQSRFYTNKITRNKEKRFHNDEGINSWRGCIYRLITENKNKWSKNWYNYTEKHINS